MTPSHGLMVSEAELEILKVLWEHGPGTVREIMAWVMPTGRKWAYNTVLTLLQRLENKGCVRSDKSHLAHRFHALVSREMFLGKQLHQLAEQVCEGSYSPLLLALVEQQDLSAEEIARFRKLLDRLEMDS